MDDIQAARALLPGWVGLAFLAALPVSFLLSALVTLGATALARRPLARGREMPWADQARLAYPIRQVLGVTQLLLPLLLGAVLSNLGGLAVSPVAAGVLAGLAAAAGSLAVTYRAARDLSARPLSHAAWRRSLATHWLVRLPFVPLAALLAAASTPRLDLLGVAVLAIGAGLLVGAGCGGGLWVGGGLGLVRKATPRVATIVKRVAGRMGVPFRGAHEIDLHVPQALAFPLTRRVAFSGPLVEMLDDRELEAIAAHELAHLAEPRGVALARLSVLLPLLVVAGARPILGSFGGAGFFWIVCGSLIALAALGGLDGRKWRRLEEDADALVRGSGVQDGAYASALEKVYAAALIPAVLPGRRKSHPDLYDRMLAAGAAPAYPRPEPPSRRPGRLLAAFAILLAMGSFIALKAAVRLASLLGTEEGAHLAVALDAGSATSLEAAGFARYRVGRTADAAIFYRAAARQDERSSHAAANLAIVLAARGECAEARTAAEEVSRRVREDRNRDLDLLTRAFTAAARCDQATPR